MPGADGEERVYASGYGGLFLQWMQILQPVPPFKVQKAACGTDRIRAAESESLRRQPETDFSGRRECL